MGGSSITGHPSSRRHERRRRALAGRKMYLAAGPLLPSVTSVPHQNGSDIRLNRTSLVSARFTWIGDSGQRPSTNASSVAVSVFQNPPRLNLVGPGSRGSVMRWTLAHVARSGIPTSTCRSTRPRPPWGRGVTTIRSVTDCSDNGAEDTAALGGRPVGWLRTACGCFLRSRRHPGGRERTFRRANGRLGTPSASGTPESRRLHTSCRGRR